MTEYDPQAKQPFSLKHNAERARKAVLATHPAAVLFPVDGGWKWGVPVEGTETADDEPDPAEQYEREPLMLAPAASEEPPEADDGRPVYDRPAFTHDDPDPWGAAPPAAAESIEEQPPAEPEQPVHVVTDADAIQAARDQAKLLGEHDRVGWLLGLLASRLEVALAVVPAPAPKPARAPRAPATAREVTRRGPKPAMDPANPPVIASPTNQVVAKLIARIQAARHDLAALRAFSFKPSSTYYAKAHDYLQACIAEAEAAKEDAA